MAHDLVVRGGTVVTATETLRCDVGIDGGRIAALGSALPSGRRELDARGLYVLPGGIDSHVHLEQLSSAGVVCADDFHSGTVSAAFGGTTTVVPFAAQHRGMKLRAVVEDYHRRASEKAVIDYAFHLIVTDPTEEALEEDLPRLVAEGITSLKVYMTYDRLRVGDEQLLDILAAARRLGALTMIHAENHGMIAWLSSRLVRAGATAPRYHAIAHPRVAEGEAVQRAIALAELVDVPILIVHVSDAAGASAIRRAQARGLRVYGETCPQYLFLTADDLDRPGLEGAKYGCSPPPRDRASHEAIWRGLADGTFQAYSSDHAPYRFDESGKLPKGDRTTFKDMANGVPGIELRLPLLFSEGVRPGRLSLNEFVALGATNHAQHLRPLSPQGHDHPRRGRGSRPLGSGAPGPRHRGDAPRPGRLHPVRGARAHGVAGHRDLARARRRPGGPAPGRAGHRAVRAGRPLGLGAPARGGRARDRAAPRARPRPRSLDRNARALRPPVQTRNA